MTQRILNLVTRHPRWVFIIMLALVAGLGAQLPRIRIDTDPENMLPDDQPARVFHNRVKERFSLHDVIVVGIVDEEEPNGVFTPDSLGHIHELTKRIQNIEGVVARDLIAPSTVDKITPEAAGVVRFDWLLKEPPKSEKEALAVRDAARRLPMFDGTLVSEDGRAIALYVPIAAKDESHRISTEIRAIVDSFEGWDDSVYITGLPVAEDTFGVQMFKQMAISAPLAALVIFLLMWWFFRSISLITSPMIVAMATVILTMGLLIGLGFTVHIMSSMIPIFLMPIAVVDSVHILSEFSDHYTPGANPKELIRKVVSHLFRPMLYTSLTSAAGFASLAFTPIPPVRVFGIFVAIGIMLAFLLTIIFIPAYVASLSQKSLARLPQGAGSGEAAGLLATVLRRVGPRTVRHAKLITAVAAGLIALSVYGISRIQINDNPVRWFAPSHRIRVADRVLNEHFAGTYPAYIVLEAPGKESRKRQLEDAIGETLRQTNQQHGVDLSQDYKAMARSIGEGSFTDRLSQLIEAAEEKGFNAEGEAVDAWDEIVATLERVQTADKAFQSPEVLRYIERLEAELLRAGTVGKSNSLADLVKSVYRDLRGGESEHYEVPASSEAVAQSLLSFQSSHKPDDLWHFVTPNFRAANIWVQLKTGDNRDMVRVTEAIDHFVKESPPPRGIELHWAGLTYINVVWQDEMVRGMLNSLLGAFIVVLVMMVVLFRSFLFGLLSMIPLSVTIALIYGLIGLFGKAYDMPVAVLSSLTLGLSVDFAIHFLQRLRTVLRQKDGDWKATLGEMFEEPGRAIARNAIVIAIGFLPLLAAPLVPYNTVGIFMAAIMAISSIVTITLLPAITGFFRRRLSRQLSQATKELS